MADWKKSVAAATGFNVMFAQRLVEDVADEKMCLQPQPGMNHAAWGLGHLANTSDGIAEMLGAARVLPTEWKPLFGSGSQPTSVRQRYPAKAQLLDAYVKGHQRALELLMAADDATLGKDSPFERLRPVFPTVGDLATGLITAHTAMHLGQLSAWRRALGMKSAF